ncbi:GM18138 [Drosophila sechellia]|uniref:GM18138 n=1 Tax=Drosophila sechellia TaxID=7238 RepID=B4I309_DROSE|nr:GM18138 [Drosophila sechellia]
MLCPQRQHRNGSQDQPLGLSDPRYPEPKDPEPYCLNAPCPVAAPFVLPVDR